jgi:nucleotide-binding universal stress UspA family protein
VKPSVIVCLVEFSGAPVRVLSHALALARRHEAELHVVHVGPLRRSIKGSFAPEVESILSERLQAVVDSVNPEGTKITTVVLTGDPAKAVLEYMQLVSADLCVVGQNGRRGSRYWSAGVLAKEVARGAQCPTIMVSSDPKAHADVDASFGNIVCGVDFAPASDVAMNEALAMAQQSGGRVTVLHVLKGFPYESVYSGSRAFRLIGEYRARVEQVRRELRSRVPAAARNWCSVDAEVATGIPHEAIVAMALERAADLIVLGVSPRTTLHRIMMASTVAGVLRHARCAVLTVPGPSSVPERASKSDIGVSADENDHTISLIS